MPISAAPSLSLECSTSYGLVSTSMKPCVDGQRAVAFSNMRYKKPLFGSTPTHWLHLGRNLCPSRVSVAADYPDSVSDSSNYRSKCSTSYGLVSTSMKPCVDGQRAVAFSNMRYKKPLFGSTPTHWLHLGRNLCPSRVSVAADYPDSVSDSSNYRSSQGFHPLEEIKVSKRVRVTKLTSAEIARTTVEARSSALLVFPGIVHSEPHEQISWAEFKYVIDDYGDMIFEISDDENIIEDRVARNPVKVYIGMDMSIHEKNKMFSESSTSYMDPTENSFEDFLVEDMEIEDLDSPVDWGMPDSSRLLHPIYFAKCLSKVVNKECDKDMDYPSNGVSIFGCLRPVYPDDEFYLRRLFHGEVDEDLYDLEWKDDADFASSSPKRHGNGFRSSLYRLDILKIELSSIYGVQSEISLDEYIDAEPDVLLHSTSAIVERFTKKGIRCNVALRTFCRKKGHHNVEEATLIGIDSLGMDVRVCSGIEVQTHRFPFKNRARTEVAAEKQIQQLLFPRARRKKLRTHGDGYDRKAGPF